MSRLTLHTAGSPHGHRASVMLEELGLEYAVHKLDYVGGVVRDAGFGKVSPLGKFPALEIADGDSLPHTLFGSGAILLHLALTTGKLLPSEPAARGDVLNWLNLVMTDLTPAVSGHFRFNVLAPDRFDYAIDFYAAEVRRCLAALDQRLGSCPYLGGPDYSVADVAAFPFVDATAKGGSLKDGAMPHLARWYAEVGAREAVQRGMKVPG